MSIASLFGGIAQGAINYSSNQANNRANMQINQMNNAFNERMWHEQNAYNSPVEQMKRLQAAGINPAAAYSNGVDNTVSSAPSAASPIPMQAYHGNELAELGNRISLDKRRNQDVDESKSRIALNGANVLFIDKKTKLTEEEITKLEKECNNISILGDKMLAEIDVLKSEKALKDWQRNFNEKTESDQINLMQQKYNLGQMELKYLSATLQERITGVSLLNEKQRAEIEKLRKANSRYDEFMDSLIAMYDANANKTGIEYTILETYGEAEKILGLSKDCLALLDELGLLNLGRKFLADKFSKWMAKNKNLVDKGEGKGKGKLNPSMSSFEDFWNN